MSEMSNNVLRSLLGSALEIIERVDEVQNSKESRFTKECAKLNAYDDLSCIIREMKRWED